MELTNQATLTQFKQTEFYRVTLDYYTKTPFNGKLFTTETAKEILEGTYWRMYLNDNLQGLY